MTNMIFLAKDVARDLRRAAALARVEDGGALFVDPDHGDVLAHAPVPPSAPRSRSHVEVRGEDVESVARALLSRLPGAAYGGNWHVHLAGPPSLSSGDHATIERLLADHRVPGCGLVMVLALKHGVEEPTLHAWRARRGAQPEPLETWEVDNPREARSESLGARAMRSTRVHIFASEPGCKRLESEIEALEAQGCVVDASTSTRGVELRLTDAARKGALLVIVPTEGYERPPRVEIVKEDSTEGVVVTSALSALFTAWSSAYRIADLVAYAKDRGIWPKAYFRRAVTTEVV